MKVALGTLFKSGSRDLLAKIQSRDFDTPEEKKLAYEALACSKDVKLANAIPLIFSPDADLRRAVGRLVEARQDPRTVSLFVAALKGRPEASRRAAIAVMSPLTFEGGTLTTQLGKLITEGESEGRKQAAEALLDLPLNEETVPHLTRLIETGEARHRLKAVGRFSEIATAQHLGFFEGLLEDPDEQIRLASYRVIVKHAEPRHLQLLVARVGDEPYGTQQVLIEAISSLVSVVGQAAVAPVLGLLSSGNTGLRSAALKILLAMPDRVEVVKSFISATQHLAGWVRDRALDSMQAFGAEVIGPALTLIKDEDPDVRGAALALLSNFEDPRVARAAVYLLNDTDWWLAINAADVLGRLKSEEAVPSLVEGLAREELRWAAAEALGRIGGELALKALSELTQDARPEIRIEALAGLAHSMDERVLPVLKHVAGNDPVKWVRARAYELVTEISIAKDTTLDEASLRKAVNAMSVSEDAPAIHRLLAMARKEGASDLHVSVDTPPLLRKGGELTRLQGEDLTAAQTEALLIPLLNEKQKAALAANYQVDACFYVPNDGRYRGSLFRDRKGLNAAFRVIPDKPPTITELGLPNQVGDIAMIHQGLIIVTGPAGCGKSTTLASLVNLVNETRRSHVLTMEDPIEFVHPFKNSLVNQREVGKHTSAYATALRGALREDPDVIVIGEMRDPETISMALTAAETGHVVLTTLNATTAAKAVERVISSFPADEQGQIRESFAGALKLILAQGLVKRADGQGRTACFEILWSTAPVCNAIRDGRTQQIPSLMQIGQGAGLKTFDDSLLDLMRTGIVTPEEAYLRAANRDTFEPYVAPKFLEELNE